LTDEERKAIKQERKATFDDLKNGIEIDDD